MGRTRIAFALLLLPLVVFSGSCDQQQAVSFGVVLPLTGDTAVYGSAINNAIELAFEEIQQREDLPYQLSLEVRDSKGDPDEAARHLRELFQGNALAAIGGVTSDEALAMVPVATEFEKILVSPSASSPQLSGSSRYFYRVWPSDLREGTKMGNFAAQSLGLKNVVVLAAETTYAKGISEVFRTEFARNEGEVLETFTYPAGTEDFSGIVDQVLELQTQAVFVADFAEPVRKILEGLKENGFRGTLLTTSAFAAPEVIAAAGEHAEDVIVTQSLFDPGSDDADVQRFVEAYRERFGEAPGIYAAHGYDAMMVLAEALVEAGAANPIDFWKGMRGLGAFDGLTGVLQFDERGDVGKFPRVYILQNGEFRDYDKFIGEKRRQLLERLEEIRRQREEALRERSP